MSQEPQFALGLDYGTNSVRALVVRCSDRAEYGSRVVDYPSCHQGVLLNPGNGLLARQYPGDYLLGLEESVGGALADVSARGDFSPARIIGIGVDTTGSSPLPVDRSNRPLALAERWRNDLSAQCCLWKDHTGWREAARITELSARIRQQYIAKCGGVYSSEWLWSKIWRCPDVAPEVFDAAYSWIEIADWIPSVLAGVTDPLRVKRGICAAGHKALEFDVHYGAIGSSIREDTLVKVIGTSICDICVLPRDKPIADIPGVCGIVDGGVLPGFYDIEAGQSAVGDIFKWWVKGVCRGDAALHAELTAEAAGQKPGQAGLIALDWNNGNRTILVDQLLSGLIVGQDPAFGARAIVERLEEYGVRVDHVVCSGGIAGRNPLLMQIYADVTGREMLVGGSSQGCALGSAVAATVLAGAHPDFETAQSRMTSLKETRYEPNAKIRVVYDRLYRPYRELHDSFGGLTKSADLMRLMKDLIEIKYAQRA